MAAASSSSGAYTTSDGADGADGTDGVDGVEDGGPWPASRILYITNRKRKEGESRFRAIAHSCTGVTHFGLASAGEDAPEIMFEDEFVDELLARTSNNQIVVLFVHGYNTSFVKAVRSASLLQAKMGADNACVVLFSWPSLGPRAQASLPPPDPDEESSLFSLGKAKKMWDNVSARARYWGDTDRAAASTSAFRQALVLLTGLLGAERVHVLAHSRGCYLVYKAMKRGHVVPFGRLATAHGDVEEGKFFSEKSMDRIKRNTYRPYREAGYLLNMFNPNDAALAVSYGLRAGVMGPRIGQKPCPARPGLVSVLYDPIVAGRSSYYHSGYKLSPYTERILDFFLTGE